MLSDIGSVGFKVDNFNRENMDTFESKWEDIKRSLTLTVQLVSSYGFTGQSLTAQNAILPIAYYLYLKNPGESYLTHNNFERDRNNIREWLIRSLLKSGVWGSGLDTPLSGLRLGLQKARTTIFLLLVFAKKWHEGGGNLLFDEEEIEDLADMRYGDRLTFALLSLLFPFVDLRNQFHVDHIFPAAQFTDRRLEDACVPNDKITDFKQRKDGLANLQLLQGAVNTEKGATMPAKWLSATHTNGASR